MRAEYVSPELFHFVGRASPRDDDRNCRALLAILAQRCISHPPHENGWGTTSIIVDPSGNLRDQTLIVPTVVCFCDIPREQLRVHMSKYGRFGLGFSRELLLKSGARPVMYVPLHAEDWRGISGQSLLSDLEAVQRSFRDKRGKEGGWPVVRERQMGQPLPDGRSAAVVLANLFEKEFLAFIKPFDSQLADSDPMNFYLEREWRKFGNLKFEPEWVQHILVADGFEAQVAAKFSEYAGRIQVSDGGPTLR